MQTADGHNDNATKSIRGGVGGGGRGNGKIWNDHIFVNTHQNCTKMNCKILAHLHNLHHDIP